MPFAFKAGLMALAAIPLVSAVPPSPPIPTAAIKLLRCGDYAGTAFHIGWGRYITAAHVLEETKACTIEGVKVTFTGRANDDLDIVELRGPEIAAKFDIDCGGFQPGREYLSIGFAQGLYRTQIPLFYSAFGRDPDSGNQQFIGSDIIPGMSGGPMIGTDGRVVGVNLQRWPSRGRQLRDTYLCSKAVNHA